MRIGSLTLVCALLEAPSALAQFDVAPLVEEFIVKPPSRRLTLNVAYGYAAPNQDKVVANFSRGSALNATIGVKRFLESDYGESQLDYAHIFLVASVGRASQGRLLDTLAPRLAPIGFSTFRFGFGARDGVGYRFQKYAVVTPYVSSGQAWTMNRWSWDTVFVGDAARLDRFAGGLRYATFSEAGAMIDVGTQFAMDFGFETMIVQPRYVFLQSFSNLMLQQFAHVLIRKAIDAIVPNALIPIAGFAVKSAFNFWLYERRKENANFPFKSEAGLQILTFRVGASFSIE